MAIKSFKSKSLKLFWEKNDSSKIQSSHILKISGMLDLIDATESIDDLKPFFRFHEYTGSGRGVYSFNVDKNFRLLFRFSAKNAHDLWYGDPHGQSVNKIMGKKK